MTDGRYKVFREPVFRQEQPKSDSEDQESTGQHFAGQPSWRDAVFLEPPSNDDPDDDA